MLQGLYSVNRKQPHNERVRLFAACNMFKKFITPSLEVSDYMFGHTQEVNVLDLCITGEEAESDEDDDIDSDNEDWFLVHANNKLINYAQEPTPVSL